MGGDGGNFRIFEPAIFLDLVIGHGFLWWLGAHDYHCLELAFDFSGFAPDKKFADIKFRHVAAFPWKYIVVFNVVLFGGTRLIGRAVWQQLQAGG